MQDVVEIAKNLELLGASPLNIIEFLISDGYLNRSEVNIFVAAMAEEDEKEEINYGFQLGEN
jgi:hypothetical protein